MKQHSPQFLALVNQAKERVMEISTQALKDKIEHNDSFTLLDVREHQEWLTGHITKAIHISKGVLERDVEKQIPNFDTPIVVYCSGGFRSILAADSLQKMGYRQVKSLQHGLQGWQDSGFALEE